jgi:molybdenum cofactor cytidylyltransferase
MIGAVVLAAGQSLRMGRPKMGLAWNNTTVIGNVVDVLLAAGVDDVLVVTGGAKEVVEDALNGIPVRTVFNPAFANGEMITTLQVGLAALREADKAALVVLGDQPQIKINVVQTVISAYQQGDYHIVVPSFQERRGHPWLVSRVLWDVLLAMKPPETMRDFLNQFSSQVNYVKVNTSSILMDLDTPQDYLLYQSD